MDQWLALNQMLHLHRSLNFAAAGVVVFLVGFILFITMRSPLVIVMHGEDKHYYQTEHKSNSITEKDVENFIRDFLDDLLNWQQLSPEVISTRISPFVTSGMSSRIKDQLVAMAEKSFKGKTLSESIASVQVQVTDKEVIASFDKVLRIDGIPLVIPTEVSFNIIRGTETRWNPMGLYVNGLTEHEGQKN